MSHQLPYEYWDLLGQNGPFLCELFHNQSQLVTQLQAANNDLQTQVMDAPDDVVNMASQAASAETCTCYNCDEKGHLLCHCLKPQKQQIHLAKPNKVNIKGLVAKAVAAAMDSRDAAKKVERAKEGF